MTISSPFDSAPVVIGHRGAAGLVPENTLPSFARAIAVGVQAVELDVHCCENELVVIHDGTLDRTTSGRGPVAAITLAELRRFDAGGGARVPTLGEVFDLVPATVGINVELKGPGTAERLARFLPRPVRRPVLVSSFDQDLLTTFAELRDDVPVAPLFGHWSERAPEIALAFRFGFINMSRTLVSEPVMAAIAGSGLKALVYTVNDPTEAHRLVRMGVWGVFTDYPDRVSRTELTGGASDQA